MVGKYGFIDYDFTLDHVIMALSCMLSYVIVITIFLLTFQENAMSMLL